MYETGVSGTAYRASPGLPLVSSRVPVPETRFSYTSPLLYVPFAEGGAVGFFDFFEDLVAVDRHLGGGLEKNPALNDESATAPRAGGMMKTP